MPLALVVRVIDTQANQQFDATYERFPVRIGRNKLNDLHVERPYSSQFHAAIDVRDRQIWVRDLGSTNGTIYQGRRLVRDQPVEVTAAPEINVGPMVLRFGLVEAEARKGPKEGNVLDLTGNNAAALQRPKPITPGAEDAYIR